MKPCDTESMLSLVLRNASDDLTELPAARNEKERSNMKTLKEAQIEQLEQQDAENGIEKVRKKYESGNLATLQVGVFLERSHSLPEPSSCGENRSARRTNWNEEAETEQLADFRIDGKTERSLRLLATKSSLFVSQHNC